MVPSIEILRILKSRDEPRMTSIIIVRNAHIVVEQVTQLMNVIAYMVFHQTTKGEKFFVNNVIVIKMANESETLTNQKESQQSSSFSLTKEQYNFS